MNILIISSAKFPEGDAESVRLYSLGRIIKELGHNVEYVGMGFSKYLEVNHFKEFKYISLRKENKYKYDRILNFVNYTKRLINYLRRYQSNKKIDYILFADLSPITIAALKAFSEKNNISLIADCVEWFSPSQFKLGVLSPFFLMKEVENRYTINKNIRVIAISKYLYKFFNEKGCKVTYIPAILDIKDLTFEKKSNDKLIILYAGSPGKKDYLKTMLTGITLLNNEELCQIEFQILGVNEEYLKDVLGNFDYERVQNCIKIFGRVERSKVIEHLRKADFTVLLRSSRMRYARAGFPTKVVESLATGTPVILNLTSDLGNYITENINGIIVENCTPESFADGIKRAILLSKNDKQIMKLNARKCAIENFDYRCYRDNLKVLLE